MHSRTFYTQIDKVFFLHLCCPQLGQVRYVTVTILPSLVMSVFPEVLWCSQLDFTDRCLRTPDRYSLVLLCWVLTVFVWRNRSLLTLRLFVCFSAARRHAIHGILLFSCPRLLFVGTPIFVHATGRLLHFTYTVPSVRCLRPPAVCSELLSVRACVLLGFSARVPGILVLEAMHSNGLGDLNSGFATSRLCDIVCCCWFMYVFHRQIDADNDGIKVIDFLVYKISTPVPRSASCFCSCDLLFMLFHFCDFLIEVYLSDHCDFLVSFCSFRDFHILYCDESFCQRVWNWCSRFSDTGWTIEELRIFGKVCVNDHSLMPFIFRKF